jgi:hypothetical protein
MSIRNNFRGNKFPSKHNALLVSLSFRYFLLHVRFVSNQKAMFRLLFSRFAIFFASCPFRFASKNNVSLVFFLFRYVSLHVHFVSLPKNSVSIRSEISETNLSVSLRNEKKFCFRFASFRFEAKITAHPTSRSSLSINNFTQKMRERFDTSTACKQ